MAETNPVKLAILLNSLPPYRAQVHRRVAREVAGVRLYTVLTHEEDGRWAFAPTPELNVVNFGPGESCWSQGFTKQPVHEFRKGGRIIEWIRREGISAVIFAGYNDVGRLRILRWCHRHGVACFVSGDSNIRADVATGVKRWVKRRALSHVLRWATGVMPFGTRGRDYFQRYGVPRERIFFFPMEPDYDLITSLPPESIAAAAQKYGLEPGRQRLLFAGRIIPVKRADLLVDAFVSIAAARPEWDLVLLGDGELRGAVESRVPPQLAARVRFLGHASDMVSVAGVYRSCDVLVLPSDFEPWALVVNEAAAAGLAIVSTDVAGAVEDLVRDGVNGRLFPAGDMAALRECLLDVTDERKTDTMKAASPGVLAEWRRAGDPVVGVRAALRYAGVLT
jgi:glycosyltransferase involved in cell wall biosynthesis